MLKTHNCLFAAVLMAALPGVAMAQGRGVTGTIPQAARNAPSSTPPWSGKSGGSGDPRMRAALDMLF